MNSVSPGSSTLIQRIIWRTITSMCLSWMLHALQPVDLLDLVEQVLLQLALTEDLEDLVRVLRAVGEGVAGAHPLALLDGDVQPLGDAVLALLAVVGA